MGLIGYKNRVLEIEFNSTKLYSNPFIDTEIDVKVYTPSKIELTIPAFWKGEKLWAIRFIPKEVGEYTFKAISKDYENIKINSIYIEESRDKTNELYLSENREYIVDSNKKPFFWLSDTWWMALSGRLNIEDFKKMANLRKKQGFNVVQLVAGLFPDMDSFDTRGANKGGFSWEYDYREINPKFFEIADKKIEYLHSIGLHIALVGAWGYYLEKMGYSKMKKHWRYLIARWGVYSSVYIAAGEATMPFYLSKNREKESKNLKKGWSKIVKYIRDIDPYNRLLTIHPIKSSINELNSKDLIDINLLQASHNSYESIKKGVELLNKSTNILTIMDEINYEGILRDNNEGVQRLSFWKSVLNGSKGFGYGVNGIWQVNEDSKPFGASVSGAAWGDIPYSVSINFKGAIDLSKIKELLEDYEWWKFKKADNLIPKIDTQNPKSPVVATIENRIFLAYFYNPIAPWDKRYLFTKLVPNCQYNYYFYNSNTYIKSKKVSIETDSKGEWLMTAPPSLDDYILVLSINKDEYKEALQFKKLTHVTPTKHISTSPPLDKPY